MNTASGNPGVGDLARLRRLYHHVVHGGTTTPADERFVGIPVTEESLSHLIRELEAASAKEP